MPRAALAAIPFATSLIAILAAQSCTHTETAGDAAPNNRYGATAGALSSVARMDPAQDAAPSYGYGYGAPPPRGEPIDVRRSERLDQSSGISEITNSPSGAQSANADLEGASLGPSGPVDEAVATNRAPSSALSSGVEREDAGLKARGPLGPFQEGLATMRGAEFAGRATATGEWFDLDAPMASHPSLPLPSLAEIVNLENGRRMVVRVNDRQPGAGEEVEVSRLVANELGFSAAPAPVSVRYLGPAPVAAGSSAGGGPAAQLGVVQPASYDGAPRLRAGYVVQVGAFGSLANAERLRAALEGAGAVQVEPTEAGGAALYRVRVGPWADRADAEAMRRRLVVSGFPNAIVRAR